MSAERPRDSSSSRITPASSSLHALTAGAPGQRPAPTRRCISEEAKRVIPPARHRRRRPAALPPSPWAGHGRDLYLAMWSSCARRSDCCRGQTQVEYQPVEDARGASGSLFDDRHSATCASVSKFCEEPLQVPPRRFRRRCSDRFPASFSPIRSRRYPERSTRSFARRTATARTVIVPGGSCGTERGPRLRRARRL